MEENLPVVRQLPAERAVPEYSGLRPDFVLFGLPDQSGAGVLLFASSHLTQAQLQEKVTGYLSDCEGKHGYPVTLEDNCRTMHVPVRRTTVRVELADYALIRASTYVEALMSLGDAWSPPEPGGSAIGS